MPSYIDRITQDMDPRGHERLQKNGNVAVLAMAEKLVRAGKLLPQEAENLQKLMTRQFLPQNLDMDSYVQMRRDGSLDRLYDDTALSPAEEKAAEATFRRCASLAVIDLQDNGAFTPAQARAMLADHIQIDSADDDDVALARVAIAAEAGDVDAKPEHVIDWEKYTKAPSKPTAADVSEFRKRQGLPPIKHGEADAADDEPEMPTDGTGVMSEAEAAAQLEAQGE